MKIYFNEKPHDVPEDTSVETLLNLLAIRTSNIAVEVNSHIIPKARHSETILRSGDRIEVVTFVGGG